MTIRPLVYDLSTSSVRQTREGESKEFRLKTTSKLPILNKTCLLPSIPQGDLVFNSAMVFSSEGGMNITNLISVTIDGNLATLHFLDDSWDFTGDFAVVSYLEAIFL